MQDVELLSTIGGLVSTIGVNGVLGFVAWKLWKTLSAEREQNRTDMERVGKRIDEETTGRRKDAVDMNSKYVALATKNNQLVDEGNRQSKATQDLLRAVLTRGGSNA